LVAIALVGEAIDLWRDEDGIREQVFSLVKERVTEAWGRRREAGATILEMRIGQSVRELKASWRDEQPDQLAKHLARLTDEEVNRLTHELDQMVVDAEIAAALQEEAPF
jgi:hypothetical protein